MWTVTTRLSVQIRELSNIQGSARKMQGFAKAAELPACKGRHRVSEDLQQVPYMQTIGGISD